MSVSVTVRMEGASLAGFAVRAAVSPQRIAALNRVMAERLADELKEHFLRRNQEPNKMSAPKSGFWADVAKATGVASADERGAVVSVAEERFRIHFYGGVVKPKTARALTIPLIKEARGMFVRDYERTTGKKLFSLPGVNVLFERAGANADRSTVGDQRGRTQVKGRTKAVGIRGRTPLRAVYALAKSARIRRDPDAIPDTAKLAAALAEEGEDFLAREKRRGGAA